MEDDDYENMDMLQTMKYCHTVCFILHTNWLVSPNKNVPQDWMDNSTIDLEDACIDVPRCTTEGNFKKEQILGKK